MSEIQKRMKEALSGRLNHDKPKLFDPDTWLDDTFDKYYPDETFVDLVVLQETQGVCQQDHLVMSSAVMRALAADVNLTSSGQDAVDAMVDAHAKADPMPPPPTFGSGQALLSHHIQQFASLISAPAVPKLARESRVKKRGRSGKKRNSKGTRR